MDDKENKLGIYFDGNGDVTKFVEKIDLVATLKGHTDEKKAIFIASKLGLGAFDVYRRLSTDDKKDAEKIKENLLKEYSREERNREEALDALLKCSRLVGESSQGFAYRILKLVGLSYSSLDAATKNIIAKDYFVKGLSTDLQVALKSVSTFSTMTLNQLSDETTRLEIAGVRSGNAEKVTSVETVVPVPDLIKKITESVITQLKIGGSHDAATPSEEEVNLIGNNSYGSLLGNSNFRGRFRGSYRNRGNSRNSGGYQGNHAGRRCRVCQSTSHLFRNCPARYCQACGSKGHDAWSPTCSNYS